MTKAEMQKFIEEQKAIIDQKDAQIKQQDKQLKAWDNLNQEVNTAKQNAAAAQTEFDTVKNDYTALEGELRAFTYGTEDDPDDDGIFSEINQFWLGAKDESGERKGGIKNILQHYKNEMQGFWQDSTDPESEKVTKFGFKKEIENYLKKRTEEDKEREEYIENQKEQIEDLLGGATNVELGKDYEEQLNFHKDNANKYAKYFMSFVGIVIFIGLAVCALFMYSETLRIFFISDYNYLIFTPILLLIVGFAIWFGTFLKDKEKEERVLSAEYTHKKQIIRAFAGYIKTIQRFDPQNAKGDSPALKKLYEEMLDSVGHNPSFRMQLKGSDHLSKYIIDRITPKSKKQEGNVPQKPKIPKAPDN